MSNVIVRPVAGSETEIGMGVFASTPPHYLVAWGEYAPDGEADGELRVLAAVDEDGNDITEKVAKLVAAAIDEAWDIGRIR